MHLESGVDAEELAAGESWYEEPRTRRTDVALKTTREGNDSGNSGRKKKKGSSGYSYSGSYEDEQELQAIFERNLRPVKRDRGAFQKKVVHAPSQPRQYKPGRPKKRRISSGRRIQYCFCLEELRELAEENIHAACDKLKDILSNYQGYRKCTLILVFDAYKVEATQKKWFLIIIFM